MIQRTRSSAQRAGPISERMRLTAAAPMTRAVPARPGGQTGPSESVVGGWLSLAAVLLDESLGPQGPQDSADRVDRQLRSGY